MTLTCCSGGFCLSPSAAGKRRQCFRSMESAQKQSNTSLLIHARFPLVLGWKSQTFILPRRGLGLTYCGQYQQRWRQHTISPLRYGSLFRIGRSTSKHSRPVYCTVHIILRDSIVPYRYELRPVRQRLQLVPTQSLVPFLVVVAVFCFLI